MKKQEDGTRMKRAFVKIGREGIGKSFAFLSGNTISEKAKERFCKDCNLPIKIFKEPYFTQRLLLCDDLYGSMEKWNLFIEELYKGNTSKSKYNNRI